MIFEAFRAATQWMGGASSQDLFGAGKAVRTSRLGSAQGQNRGQLPRSNQRVTRGGTVLRVEGVGLGI